MKIININGNIDKLESLGFKKKEEMWWGAKEIYYCWYAKKEDRSPVIKINGSSGIIKFHMCTTYYMRPVPDILLDLINMGIVDRGE